MGRNSSSSNAAYISIFAVSYLVRIFLIIDAYNKWYWGVGKRMKQMLPIKDKYQNFWISKKIFTHLIDFLTLEGKILPLMKIIVHKKAIVNYNELEVL